MVTFLLAFFTIGTYCFVKDVFHPAFVMFFFWTSGFVTTSFLPGFRFPQIETQVIIAIYISLFCVASIATGVFLRVGRVKNFSFTRNIDYSLFYFLVILCGMSVSYYSLQRAWLIANYDSLREFFFNIRAASLEGQPLVATSALMQQLKTMSVMLCLVAFFVLLTQNLTKKENVLLKFFLFLVSIASIIEGTRSEFIMLSFSCMMIFFCVEGFKKSYKAIGIFLTGFFVISMYTRGGKLLDSDIFVAIGSFLEHLLLYAFGSIGSFEAFVINDFPISSSIAVKIVETINSIANVFGLGDLLFHPPVGLLPFANIATNLETNVYSFLSVRIHYLGYYGAAFAMVLHAIIITVVYKYFRKNILMFFVYILMFVATVLSLFHEYFYAYLPYYYRIFFVVLLLYYLKPFCLIRERFFKKLSQTARQKLQIKKSPFLFDHSNEIQA